jgi:nucleoporin p58/p45
VSSEPTCSSSTIIANANQRCTSGALAQQPQPQSNPLGQSQQQQQQQQQPSIGLGSTRFGLTMGQSNNQQTVPGVRIDLSNLKGTTRFNDLQEGLQKLVEQADTFIAEQQRRKGEVDSFMSGHGEMLESVPDDVTFVARKYDGARNALESAAQSIESARLLIKQDADNARLSFRAIDNMKLPQQYHTSAFWSPRQQASGNANAETDGQDLVGFFSKTADEMGDQMKKYEKNLTEIELHMHGVSDSLVEQLQRMMAAKNGASSGPDEKIQELVAVLRGFEQGILKVAGDVGSAREGMTRLQLGDFLSHERDTNGVY